MGGFYFTDSGIAASVYFALYTIFLGFMTYILHKRGVRTLYSFIFLFALFRFGGQLCGVVYSKLGPVHWQWLIAYLCLSAEGYVTLVFTSFRFTCNEQAKRFGKSWVLEDRPFRSSILRYLIGSWSDIFYWYLIIANVLVVVGGSLMAGIDYDEYENESGLVKTTEGLRCAGQTLFLLLTITATFFNVWVFYVEKVRTHVTIAILCASPFLLVRGVFGILAIFVDKMNYYKVSNYIDAGMSQELVIYEYVLSTTMEFVASVFLISRIWFERADEARLNSVELPDTLSLLKSLA